MMRLLRMVAVLLALASGYIYLAKEDTSSSIISSAMPAMATGAAVASQGFNKAMQYAQNKIYPDDEIGASSTQSGVHVFTCKDSVTEATTFSDTPCGSNAVQIKVRQANVLDSSGWRKWIAEKQYQRQQAASKVAAARSAALSSNKPNNKESSFDRETRIRNCLVDAAQVKSKFGKMGRNQTVTSKMRAEAERRCYSNDTLAPVINEDDYRAPPPSAPPRTITNCDAAGCWDTQGGRYNHGAGNTYFSTNGGACQMIGGQMQCP